MDEPGADRAGAGSPAAGGESGSQGHRADRRRQGPRGPARQRRPDDESTSVRAPLPGSFPAGTPLRGARGHSPGAADQPGQRQGSDLAHGRDRTVPQEVAACSTITARGCTGGTAMTQPSSATPVAEAMWRDLEQRLAGPGKAPLRVLFGADGSAPAEDALRFLAALPLPPGSAIRAITALEGSSWLAPASLLSSEQEAAAAAVEHARASLTREGV